GNLLVQNSTIANNSAGNATAGAGAGGGGISKTNTGGTVTLVSTIVSGNTAAAGAAAADVASAGTRPFGANLALQPLANNGGPTQTMALGSTSAAIDAGSNTAGLTTDQ